MSNYTLTSPPENNYFQTNIIDPKIKLVTLSDIHGDLQAFLITLRDCAKVIKKKDGFNFHQNEYDKNLEIELNKNLNNDSSYEPDLNYEWIGENTYVVICGDIIDPSRTHTCLKTKDNTNFEECSYYPQIELKILLFINALNLQAQSHNSKIIKLLGNHELSNILIDNNSINFIKKYSYSIDQNTNYYQGISRLQIFNVGQPGFNLLFEGGCGLLVKVNNTICVHGGLSQLPYNYFDKINQIINYKVNHNSIYQDNWNDDLKNLNNDIAESPLWNRDLGDPVKASNRILQEKNVDSDSDNDNDNIDIDNFDDFNFDINFDTQNTNIDNSNDNDDNSNDNHRGKKSRIGGGPLGDKRKITSFCDDLLELFKIFKDDGSVITEDPNNLMLVVGHCNQSDLSIFNGQDNLIEGITYQEKVNTGDPVTDTYYKLEYKGKPEFSDRSKIFGITMECKKDLDSNQYRLYRVDIGSSRGYDYFDWNTPINSIEDENRFLYSKTPQILVFDNNNIYIVKSKIKNTRIHLPRQFYENRIESLNITELNIKDDIANPNYKNKYLKYKNKYLELKLKLKLKNN